MPDWLGAIAMWNPVSATATATAIRELFATQWPAVAAGSRTTRC